MKAVRFDHYGEPTDVLSVTEQPVPEPGPGEVRLKIKLSPVNPSDLLYVRGHYSGVAEHFPSGAGFESVSAIDALGPGVEGLSVGQRVFAHNGRGGNWSEYAAVAAQTAWPVPDDLPDAQVASLMINPATAILMVRHVLAVPRGQWLLQSAAGSELGRMIIRLAKHDDIRTINVVRRHEAVHAHLFVDGPLTGHDHLVGAEVLQILYWLPRLQRSGFFPPGRPAIQQLIDEIAELIRAGVLETSPGKRFGLDQIHAAVAEAESVGRSGKVLIAP
jgi:NADPH:quinone reductase